MSKTTIEIETRPYAVQLMTLHPLTGEILFAGDVREMPPHLVEEQVRAGVVRPLPEGTPENTAPRDEHVPIVGVTISEAAFEAKQIAAALQATPSVVGNLRPGIKQP